MGKDWKPGNPAYEQMRDQVVDIMGEAALNNRDPYRALRELNGKDH